MNKKIIISLLLLVMGVSSYAQKLPIKFFKPSFPTKPGIVNMAALRASILNHHTYLPEATSFSQLAREMAKADIARSVFRAYPLGETDAHAMSGFIFKTTYQGKEEIFGAIAQHAMILGSGGGGDVEKLFTARVMQNDQVVDIPAEVVQMSSPTFSDVALVKFRPEDEALLTPLPLAEQDPVQDDPLTFVGFGIEKLTFLTDSPLSEKSPISLRFPVTGEEWPGLCGSPVLNDAGEVVGTMTGIRRDAPYSYTGFATRNLYLQSLVAAYHKDVQNASFPLILGGEKITDLQPDEFVYQIILKDENSNTLLRKVINTKFSFSAIQKLLPSARYVELYISKVWWSGYALIEGNPVEGRRVIYDFKEKTAEDSSASVISNFREKFLRK